MGGEGGEGRSKKAGNEAFGRKDYQEAVRMYCQVLPPSVRVARSPSRARPGASHEAAAVKLNPSDTERSVPGPRLKAKSRLVVWV